MVPFSGKHGEQISFEPKVVEYCKLRYDSFSEIKIELLDDTGSVMKFTSGKVFVTLHIKEI